MAVPKTYRGTLRRLRRNCCQEGVFGENKGAARYDETNINNHSIHCKVVLIDKELLK